MSGNRKEKNCVEKLFPITSNFWQLFIYVSRRPLSHYEYAGKFFIHRKQKAPFSVFKILSRTWTYEIYMGTFLQVHLNDEDPNLQELLQAGRGGILMEDFVKYSLDMKLLDVQVFESMTWKKFQW